MNKRRFSYIERQGESTTFLFKDAQRPLCYLQVSYYPGIREWGDVFAVVPRSSFEHAHGITSRQLVRHIPKQELARLMAGSIRSRR